MGAKETNLTKRITDFIVKNYGALVMKYWGSSMSIQGFPDIFGCWEGKFFAIEVKVGTNEPRPNQHEWLRKIKEYYKGKAIWVNEENWREKIENMFKEMENE